MSTDYLVVHFMSADLLVGVCDSDDEGSSVAGTLEPHGFMVFEFLALEQKCAPQLLRNAVHFLRSVRAAMSQSQFWSEMASGPQTRTAPLRKGWEEFRQNRSYSMRLVRQWCFSFSVKTAPLHSYRENHHASFDAADFLRRQVLEREPIT